MGNRPRGRRLFASTGQLKVSTPSPPFPRPSAGPAISKGEIIELKLEQFPLRNRKLKPGLMEPGGESAGCGPEEQTLAPGVFWGVGESGLVLPGA